MSKVVEQDRDRETRMSFSRKRGQEMHIGSAVVKVIGIGTERVRLLIRAPRSMRVLRGEARALEGIQDDDGTAEAERVDS